MGGYENLVKIEEIKKKVEEGELQIAQKILDTMDIKKIKNILDMNLLAEVYEANGRYEEAKDLYLNIYKKAHSRKSLFKLINILIKLNDSREAEYYFEQYERIAPDDFYNYIFRYYIEKIKGGTYESLIAILEELKKKEYIEKWAYELAKLYYKAGMEEECIRECSDIVLWFGEGTYVEKAKILRSYYAGEADKEWIMRELKRRSKSEEGQAGYNSSDDNAYTDYEDAYSRQQYTGYGAAPDGSFEGQQYEGYGATSDGAYVEQQYAEYDPQEYVSYGEQEHAEYSPQEYETYGRHEYAEYGAPADAAYKEQGYEEYNPQADGAYVEQQYAGYDPEYGAYDERGYAAYDNQEAQENTTTDGFDDFKVNVQDYIDEPNDYYNGENGYNYEVTDEQLVAENPEYEYIDSKQKEYDIFSWLEKEYDFNAYEVFDELLQEESVKAQLVSSMENILADEDNNVVMLITGSEEANIVSLAKKIAIFLNWIDRLQTSKLAKINADKLNTINIFTKKDLIKDCCLLIENASRLTDNTINSIIELSQELPSALAVIFADNVNNLTLLFGKYPNLSDFIRNEIHLEL